VREELQVAHRRLIGGWYEEGMKALLFVLLPLTALAGDRELTKKDVPEKVIAAVLAHSPSAVLKRFELEDGNYEIAIADAKGKADVVVTPEGKVLTEERTIAASELPAPVTKGLAAGKYSKARVKSVERITDLAKPEAPTFELNVALAGEQHELVYDAAGALKTDEKK
jgi:hypothetical protein